MKHPFTYQKQEAIKLLTDQLEDFNLELCPFKTFEKWYAKAAKNEVNVDAMSVATVSSDGIPRNRFLLFKGAENSKFIFFTHYTSQKAQDLAHNPNVSLNFFWPTAKYQIRITGKAHLGSREKSVNYFQSRDRESQLASYVSKQSEIISDRKSLLIKLEEARKKFQQGDIPCPETWGSYELEAFEFEFFIYGDFRINDRFVFKKDSRDQWILERVQP